LLHITNESKTSYVGKALLTAQKMNGVLGAVGNLIEAKINYGANQSTGG
jgi:hypothetical protein